MKIKSVFEDILWNIKSFIAQPIIPIVTMDYILKNKGSYSSNDMLKDKYVYYWIGDFKSGKQVKVKSIDVLKYQYQELAIKYNDLERKVI